MSRPGIGKEIRYTDHGKNVYFQLNKRFPKNDGVLGKVESFASEGRICVVRNGDGEAEFFIWRFSDGLNSHFVWEGKDSDN